MEIDEMKALLQKTLSRGRYLHTLSVCETALRLSDAYGLDRVSVERAALLHDCAKHMSVSEMLSACEREGVAIDEIERRMEPVLHAPAGAAVAKAVYGVSDEEVLSAIRWHTIGKPNMTRLEALIYTVDFAEPLRKPFQGLDEVRALLEHDLSGALRLAARLSSSYLISSGRSVHPLTLKMINDTEVLS